MKIPAGPLVAVAICLVMVVTAEFALGWLAPLPDPYAARRQIPGYVPSAHAPDVSLRIAVEPDLPGVEPVGPGRTNGFSTNGLGFRGDALERPKPAAEWRVFVVGGSTTENIVLDDSNDMSRLLQERLDPTMPDRDVRVYNAGKSGDRSYDHLAMIGQRIAHLEPDVIVLFTGINDLMAGLFEVDYLHLEPRRLRNADLLQLLAGESQLFRRVHGAARRFRRRSAQEIQETIEFETNYAEKAALQRTFEVVQTPPAVDLDSYEDNLRSILGIARAHEAALVLMTQASTWNSSVDPTASEWHWMRLRRAGTFAEDVMDAALERYNDTQRQLAHDEEIPLLDLAADLPKSLEYFFDDVHFNDAGARHAAERLAGLLETIGASETNLSGEPPQ